MIQRRRAADIIVQQLVKFRLKRTVLRGLLILGGQLVQGPGQRFWDVTAAKVAESTSRIGHLATGDGCWFGIHKAIVATEMTIDHGSPNRHTTATVPSC